MKDCLLIAAIAAAVIVVALLPILFPSALYINAMNAAGWP